MAYLVFFPARQGLSGVRLCVGQLGAMYWRSFAGGRSQRMCQNTGALIAADAGTADACETVDPLLPTVLPRPCWGWSLFELGGICRFPALAGMRGRG